MGCPNSKNRPKKGLRPLGVNSLFVLPKVGPEPRLSYRDSRNKPLYTRCGGLILSSALTNLQLVTYGLIPPTYHASSSMHSY
jgi:hypothetical protein